jgi:hypothetical protein
MIGHKSDEFTKVQDIETYVVKSDEFNRDPFLNP